MAQAQKRRPASNWAPIEAPPPQPPSFVDRLLDAVSRRRPALRRFGIAASVLIIAISATIFLRTLIRIDPNKVKAAIAGTGGDQITLSFAFTALSYLALTGYDALALRHLKIKVPYRLTALASFASYAFSFTLGFPLVTGGAVRYWIYGPAGLSAGKVASLTIVAGITFWLGMGLVVGSGFLSASDPVADIDHFHPLANRLIGAGVVGAVIVYLAWISRMRWRNAAVVGDFKLPGPMLTLGQMALGVIDICSASAALYVLLPKADKVWLSHLRDPLFLRRHARHRQSRARRPWRVRGDDPSGRRRQSGRGAGLAPAFSRHLLRRPVPRRDGDAGRRRGCAPLAFAARSDVGRVGQLAGNAMPSADAQMLADLVGSPFASQLVGAMPEPAIIVGPDERAAAANKPALELLPGLRVGDPFVLGLRAPDVIDARRRVMASGEAETVQWSERVPVERLFDVCVAPLATEDGEVVATLITLRDQTEARRVERLRVDFIANASHELRTPLASLVGFIETLQGSAHDDAKARDRFLAIMREQGRRMARLIEDLLSLSRIEQKQHVRPETVVDLAQTTRSVVDALTPMAGDLGVEIRLSAAEPVMVAGDRDELLRVAENLIENAIKYGARADSDAAGVVEVAVSMTEKEGSLSVRDYGYGIAPEHLPRLTERFYRVDATQSRAKNGTGLGLAIVKHILTRHRGRLNITSRVNQGSCFVAVVPLQQKTKP